MRSPVYNDRGQFRYSDFVAYIPEFLKSEPDVVTLLQVFSDYVLTKALHVATELAEELMTRLTKDIQTEYLFHGA